MIISAVFNPGKYVTRGLAARLPLRGFFGKKKQINEMKLEDFDKSSLQKYEAEYNKLMYGKNDDSLDEFLDKMGFSDMKNFEKMDPKEL